MPTTLNILLKPELDAASFNSIVEKLKGVGFKIDPATAASFKAVTNETLASKSAIDALDKATKKTGESASGLQKAFSFNQITQSVQTMASTFAGLTDPFTKLDTATAQMRTLGTEAASMAPDLREAALAMSQDLPFSAAEFQTTMFDAMASGVKGGKEGLKSFADESAKLAVGGAATLSDSTKLLAGNLNAYGKSAEEAGKFSDIVFNTVNYGVTSVAELNAGLSNVVPTASAFGVELENVGASLAVMTSKGVPTAQATTKLNQLLLEIAKPGAALAPILKKAGVSLESLKQDDLPVTLNKINKALKETGQTAVGAFSSSDAAAGFNVLAGDLEGFQQTFEDVRDTTGSAQFAFEQMGDSVQVNLDGMKAKTEAFLIQGVDKLGAGFVTVTSAATQLAPTVASIAGLKNIIPDGLISNAGTFAKSLVGKVVPGIIATEGASAAGATGFQVMWAAATGPIGLTIAGIAAVAVGLHFLSDALHETAAEKLEDNATEQELIKTQQQSTQAKYNNVLAGQALAKQYESLANNTNRTTEENNKFIDVSGKVASVFPGVTAGGKTTEEQMKALKAETSKSSDELIKLGAELFNLNNKLAQAQTVQLNLEVDVAKEDVENQLTDSLDKSFFDSIKSVLSGDFKDLGGDLANLQTLGFAQEIQEGLTGTSATRKAVEGFSKSFTDGIYNAKSADEIASKTAEFTAKIALDGDKMGVSKEEQLKVIKSINDLGKKRIAALKTQADNEKNLTVSSGDIIAKQLTDQAKLGVSAADAIKKIAVGFNISEAAAKKAALAGTLREAAKEGEPTKEKIAEIAKTFGVTAEEAARVVEEQKKQKKQAEEVAGAVLDVAKRFGELKKAAADALTKSQDTGAGLALAIKDIQKLIREGTFSYEDLQKANTEYALTAKDTTELIAALQNKEREVRKKANEEYKRNNEIARIENKHNVQKSGDDNVKGVQNRVQTAKDGLDKIARFEEDAAKATISNQNELAKKLLQIQIKNDIDKINEDVKVQQAQLSKVKNSSASQNEINAEQIKLDQLHEAIKVKTSEGNEKLKALDGKFAVERYNAKKKLEDELASREIDRANKAAERLANSDLVSGETALQRAEKLSESKLKILELQTDKEINEVISKNDGVVQAEKEFEDALLSQNEQKQTKAATALAEAKAKAYGSPLVQAAAEKEITEREKLEKDFILRVEQIRIKGIQSATEREAQTGIVAAKELFDKQFKEAEGNRALELDAITEFGKKKLDIVRNQAVQESSILAGLLSFKENLIAEFNKVEDDSSKQELEKIKQDNAAKSAELLKSLQDGKEKYAGYTKSIIELGKKQSEAEEAANKSRFGLLDKLQKAAVATFSNSAQAYALKTSKMQEDYLGMLAAGKSTEDELANQRIGIFQNVASSGLSQLAQFAAAGTLTAESAIKVMLKSALSAVQAMVPVWSAQILGVSLGTPQSALTGNALGIAGWLAATALITTAIEAAKAAIGNKKGDSWVRGNNKYGTIDGKPATMTSDNIPRLLSEGEAVLNARANNTRGTYFYNYELVEISNKTSKSFEEIVLSKHQSTSHSKFIQYPKPSAVIASVRQDLIQFSAFEKAIRQQTAQLLPVLGAIADNTNRTGNEVKKQTKMLAAGSGNAKQAFGAGQTGKQSKPVTLGGSY